ncbi:MAG: hypothetical protein J2P15_14345 [Micromonosporaceae bacterium]|nr:hypothetical protein [Micromonosporaceae bacterium]
MPNAILDPTGRTSHRAPAVLAKRPADLSGAVIGLLENTKKNAVEFLGELGRLLVERHNAAGTVLRTKTNFALPVSDELRDEFARDCAVVITGVGDCGSCSASAVADGVTFERAGVPAVVICSDAFRTTADAMAQRQGAAGYRYLTTPHPVAPLAPDQIRQRAEQLLPQVVEILIGQSTVEGSA